MPGKSHKAFLGLGSNLGDKERNLQLALQFLPKTQIQIVKTSSIYATEPVDFKDQDWFLNQVACLQTSLDPRDLLNHCLQIEQRMGRQRIVSKGPRSIDLDILLYNDLIVEEKGLFIPHPRMHLRRFVLVPLAALAAEVVHPILKQSITSLLEQCPDDSKVVMFQ